MHGQGTQDMFQVLSRVRPHGRDGCFPLGWCRRGVDESRLAGGLPLQPRKRLLEHLSRVGGSHWVEPVVREGSLRFRDLRESRIGAAARQDERVP
jgi:hypothetical protein